MIERRFATKEEAQAFFAGIDYVNDSSVVADAPEWTGVEWVIRIRDSDEGTYPAAAPRVIVNERGDLIEEITPGTAPCSELGLALATAWNPSGWSARKVAAAFKKLGIEPDGTVLWRLHDGELSSANSYGLKSWEALVEHYRKVEGLGGRVNNLTPPRRLVMTREEAAEDLEAENKRDRIRVLDDVIELLRGLPIAQSSPCDGFHIDELQELRTEVANEPVMPPVDDDVVLQEARRYRKALCMTKERLAQIASMSQACLDAVNYVVVPALAGQEPIEPPGVTTGRVDTSVPHFSNPPRACSSYWIAIYETGDGEYNAFPIYQVEKPSDEQVNDMLPDYCEDAEYYDLTGPWEFELPPVPCDPFWVVVYEHKHGTDVWPWFDTEPTEEEVVAEMAKEGTEYEGPDNHEYLNYFGPFYVRSQDKPQPEE